jgi:hypothetical protein
LKNVMITTTGYPAPQRLLFSKLVAKQLCNLPSNPLCSQQLASNTEDDHTGQAYVEKCISWLKTTDACGRCSSVDKPHTAGAAVHGLPAATRHIFHNRPYVKPISPLLLHPRCNS